MSQPPALDLDALSHAELKALVIQLLGTVAELKQIIVQQREEIGQLRDEIARLKGLPPRPSAAKAKPSGMERATNPETAGKKRSRRHRGAKRAKLTVTREVVLKPEVPAGSRFKGYEDILVQDLCIKAEVIRYRRERWLTAEGQTIVAALPPGIAGGYGPELQRVILGLHTQGQVTSERLEAILTGAGIAISKRQVLRLIGRQMTIFEPEDQAVLRAGLATARWITVDDTGTTLTRKTGFVTQIGDDRFTAFRSGETKSRERFLSVLRAGHTDYRVSAEAIAYMRARNLTGAAVEALQAHPDKTFADEAAWKAHLAALGIDQLEVTPDPVAVATEGALWGAVRDHGFLSHTVVVSDGAGQFRIGDHALCWVHAERLVHKLVPVTREQRRAVEIARTLIWWLYRDLKLYKIDPCPKRAAALRARFDRIFQRRSGYVTLDQLMIRLHRRKPELLRVLDRPEIPLHTNGSENDIRAFVTKRGISGGTMSEDGRIARDVMLGLQKTCMKLGISFWRYLGDRLGIPGPGHPIPPLADLVFAAAPS
jgi:Transposase IS66 family